MRFGNAIQPHKSDVIIVLGAQVWGYEPSPSLKERCNWAYELYRQGYAPKLILSGAHGDGYISEAEAMRRYLAGKGIPHDVMILEEQSHSTRTNLLFSKQIMEREGMKTAILVTNRFHQKRAQLLAKQLNMNTSGYAAKSQALFEPYWVVREVLAITKDSL
ncbi:YdcF family protein [Effusibacillus consociatus]|uniref:YdcF family protein n=1 Tax=Effusibacillus consociatus TaxID=1117041 RepID=A0ABV9PXB3_9BACL